MKFISTIVIIILGIDIYAQSILKTAPGLLPFGAIEICFERANNPKASYEISAGYLSQIGDIDVNAFAIGLGLKAYLLKKETPTALNITI
jgi:hypothetical protein